MAADIVWPLGVTMWRNGASARTRSSAFSKAGASLAANPFSSTAPAASVFTLAPDSGSPLSRSRVTAARIVLIRGCGRAAPSGSRFTVEEGALALDAPAVARERAVVAHDPVAGNGDRDRVRRASLPDCAHGFRRADALRDLRVRHRGSGRDLAQRLPDALLKGGAAHIERQVEPERRRFDEADHLGDPLLEVLVAADQGPPWRPIARSPRRRRSRSPWESGPRARAPAPRACRPAEWRTRLCRWRRPGSSRASIRRRRSGSPRRCLRSGSGWAAFPAPARTWRRSGRSNGCSRVRSLPARVGSTAGTRA